MSLTRKDTKAMLTLLWQSCTDAYLLGYAHGSNGLETPDAPYPQTSVTVMDQVAVKDLDGLSKQIAELAKHFS